LTLIATVVSIVQRERRYVGISVGGRLERAVLGADAAWGAKAGHVGGLVVGRAGGDGRGGAGGGPCGATATGVAMTKDATVSLSFSSNVDLG